MPFRSYRFRRFPAAFISRGVICVSLAVTQAQNPPMDEKKEAMEEQTGFLASGTLFPDNSILKDVLLPNYDLALNLTSTLSAEELKIVTKQKIEGKNLLIEFFKPDRSSRGRIAMKSADFSATKKLLSSDDPVSFASDDLDVAGTSLIFDLGNNRGFLHGPVKAVSRTDMKTSSLNAYPNRRGLTIGALLVASVFPLPAQQILEADKSRAAEIAALRPDPAAIEKMVAEAASKRPQLARESSAAEEVLTRTSADADDARISMNSFFQAASLTALLAEPATAAGGAVPRPVVEQLKEETTITSKQGAFIDNKEGLIVFLKDVHVANPEFKLSAQDEVKIFMEPEPEEDKKAAGEKDGIKPKEGDAAEEKPTVPKEVDPEEAAKWKAAKDARKAAGAGGGKNDIKRIVASGNVVVDYQKKGEEPIKASARTVIYDFEKEQILLHGGSPWVIQGNGNPVWLDGDDAYILILTKDDKPQRVITSQDNLRATFSVDAKGKDTKKKEAPKKEAPKPNNR